jgi:uncharacterized NAD(P)/FAD-binding protein YdhS
MDSSASAEGALKPFESVAPDRLAAAKPDRLIGSGLTMVDVLLAARRDGFRGTALVVSRRGQLPRPHAPKGVAERDRAAALRRVSLLAAAIRISCEMAEESGTPGKRSSTVCAPRFRTYGKPCLPTSRRASCVTSALLGLASPPASHGGA